MASEKEKRRAARYSLRWRIHFASNGHSLSGKTIDVSVSGVSFLSETAVSPSTNAQIRLFLPPSDIVPKGYRLSASAKVVYCILQGKAGFRVGMEFTAMDRKDSDLLSKCLESQPYANLS